MQQVRPRWLAAVGVTAATAAVATAAVVTAVTVPVATAAAVTAVLDSGTQYSTWVAHCGVKAWTLAIQSVGELP